MGFYTKEDAALFKGRDEEIERLVSNVSSWPLTILIGESGVGKTSLIQAGLFPWLEMMSWNCIWTRPFDNPMENIKKMIWNELFIGEPNDTKLLDVLKQAAEECKPHKLLIVMDQFEDILNCSAQNILDDFSLVLAVIQTGTTFRNVRVLISFREDALVKLNSRLLKRITGSAYQFPSVELERLTKEGAKSAFVAGLENGGIGLGRGEGNKPLLDIVLDDIRKGDDRLFPPYVQIVAETLCKAVNRDNPIITREMYSELGGANQIIADYLMELLNEFVSQKDEAERVLVFLTSSTGRKVQKSLSELNRETGIEIDELKEIMGKMVDLRMARAVDGEFEITHDYLGKIVDEELVRTEDRTIKLLEEQLEVFCQNYKMDGTPVRSTSFLARLYKNRERIEIDDEKLPFILCTALMNDGIGWYWLKDLNMGKMYGMIENLMSHEIDAIGDRARMALLSIAQPEDWEKIVEMLHDKSEDVQRAAIRALGKIAQPEDWEKIVEMLHDKSEDVQRAAAKAFLKIAQPEDRDKIVEMLHDEDWHVQETAIRALGKIAQPEDRDKIVEMLHDKNEDVRRAAVKAFLKIAQPEDKEKIVEMLHDEDWYIQDIAAKAFLKIAQPGDKEHFLDSLADQAQRYSQEQRSVFRILSRMDMILYCPCCELLHSYDCLSHTFS